ncbi:MAG: HAMP domain-containing histidine kinase [Ruminococcaceae bacterium]|nr:HAMP domain-containing histidine kinase [Oscillospiraceae bacterium]
MKDGARRRRIGIRWQLFGTLAILTIIFILVLWVFQIRLLSYFYEREKFAEMQRIATELSNTVASPDFEARVQTYARESNACICFYTNGNLDRDLVEAHSASDCVVHYMTEGQLLEIYDMARANGGTYDRRLEVKNPLRGGGEEEEFRVPMIHPRSNDINAIHARLLQKDGTEYLMIMDMPLSPVSAVTKTMELQFLWIAAAMLLAAFVIALLASHIIAHPLTDITEKARKMAAGNYEPNFAVKTGYREVKELADVLNRAAIEIGATDRLQKELIANISHDLRTPLTMIKGYSEMMRDIPGENSPENVQAIIDETTRLTELVNDLMDLSKLQAGTQKLTPCVFDLTATVQDTMQRYDTLIRHEGYRIEFDADKAAFVQADRTMILQVIYNLINNAVNYTGQSKRVVVTQRVSDRKVRLSVADDGEGIPPDQISEIWDRYYRVDKVHKRSVMGTGLGLSIVKGVLEAHNATYGVDSAVGVGSVFWFELDLCDRHTDTE